MGSSSKCCGCCRARCRPRGCTAGVGAWSLGSQWSASSGSDPGLSWSCASSEGAGCWPASFYVCRLPAGCTASSVHPEIKWIKFNMNTTMKTYHQLLKTLITISLFCFYCFGNQCNLLMLHSFVWLISRRDSKCSLTRMSSGSKLCSLQAEVRLLLGYEPDLPMSSSSS